MKNETIYFPIGALGEVDAISGNKVAILIGGSSIHVQLDEIELWVPPAPDKKCKRDEVKVEVPDGFPYAVASIEQWLGFMQMMAVVVLYEVNAKLVESKVHNVQMLHDPDRVFVGKNTPANKLSIVPFSTSVVKKKIGNKTKLRLLSRSMGQTSRRT